MDDKSELLKGQLLENLLSGVPSTSDSIINDDYDNFLNEISSEDSNEEESDNEEEKISKILGIKQNKRKIMQASTPFEEETDNFDAQIVDENLLQDYLSGEISFEEFNEFLSAPKQQSSDEEDDVANIDEPLPKKVKNMKQSAQKKKKGDRTLLPAALQGLMGQANLLCAKTQYDEAIKICTEIIKESPNAYEPYETLKFIYEEKGDLEKCSQFGLLSGLLGNCKNIDQWVQLGELNLKIKNRSQAIFCYRRAAKFDRNNIGLNWHLVTLLLDDGDFLRAGIILKSMLKYVTDRDIRYKIYKTLLKAYKDADKFENSLTIFKNVLKEFPSEISCEDINQALDVCLSKQKFSFGIDIMENFKGVSITRNEINNSVENITIADNIPIGIRIKVLVCLLQTVESGSKAVEELVEPILQNQYTTNKFHSEKEQMIDALMTSGLYEMAIKLLEELLKSVTTANLLVKYGRCLNYQKSYKEAMLAIEKAKSLDKIDMDDLLILSVLYKRFDRIDDAINCLDLPNNQQDSRVVLQRCLMLLAQKEHKLFMDLISEFFFKKFDVCFLNKKFFIEIVTQRSIKHRLEVVNNILSSIGDTTLNEVMVYFKPVSSDSMFDMYKSMVSSCLENNDVDNFEKVAQFGLMYPPFLYDEKKLIQIDQIVIRIGFIMKNSEIIYKTLRPYCYKYPESINVWNLYGQFLNIDMSSKHLKFLIRISLKTKRKKYPKLLIANQYLSRGSYYDALEEYFELYLNDKQDPLVLLCISACLINIVGMKSMPKKNKYIALAFTFLNKYRSERNFEQETFYNLGRAFHQLGLSSLAVDMYKKALKTNDKIDDKRFDLTKEIAHNLSLIYVASGANRMARWVLEKYATI